MKINDILIESSEQYSNEQLFDIILNSEFYEKNKHNLDEQFALFRGLKISSIETNTIHRFQFRERPLDSSILIHDMVNEISEQDFGIKIRNLMFGTNNLGVADGYGSVYVLFPIGNYQLYYSSTIGDFFFEIAHEDTIDNVLSRHEDDFEFAVNSKIKETIHEMDKDDRDIAINMIEQYELNYLNSFIGSISLNLDRHENELRNRTEQAAEKHVYSYIKDNNSDINNMNAFMEFIKGIYLTAFNEIIQYLEETAQHYLANVEETEEIDDAGDNEIMIYCDKYILLDHEQYIDFIENYHQY